MAPNWETSHYGQLADLQSFDNGTYYYGSAEEVLTPSTYSPSGYVQYLSQKGTLHLSLLESDAYTYYGYHIGVAPNAETYGCSNNEIPGPDVNTTQYLKSIGCTVVVQNTTWLVLELAAHCT
jgi:hypothetical protein